MRGFKKVASGAWLKYGGKSAINAGTLAELKTLITSTGGCGDISNGIKKGDIFIFNEIPCVAPQDFLHNDEPVELCCDGVWVVPGIKSFNDYVTRGEWIMVGPFPDPDDEFPTTPEIMPIEQFYNMVGTQGRIFLLGMAVSEGKLVENGGGEAINEFEASVAIGTRNYTKETEYVEPEPEAITTLEEAVSPTNTNGEEDVQ